MVPAPPPPPIGGGGLPSRDVLRVLGDNTRYAIYLELARSPRPLVTAEIAELLGRKRALADAVLGRGEAALTELSNEELRDLVRLRPDRV